MGFARILVCLLFYSSFTTISVAQQAFRCTEKTSCHSLVGYKSPNTTSISSIQKLFGVKNRHSLLGANNLPLSTPSNYVIREQQVIKIPIPCICFNGTGASNKMPIYTVQPGDTLSYIASDVFMGLLTYPRIQQVNQIENPDKINASQEFWIPLPCSCEEVDGREGCALCTLGGSREHCGRDRGHPTQESKSSKSLHYSQCLSSSYRKPQKPPVRSLLLPPPSSHPPPLLISNFEEITPLPKWVSISPLYFSPFSYSLQPPQNLRPKPSNARTPSLPPRHQTLPYLQNSTSKSHSLACASTTLKLWIPLPCSCDDVDGVKVVQYGHVMEDGSSLELIGQEYGTKVAEIFDGEHSACNSSVREDSLDSPFLVPNNTYFLTASNCVKCKCDAANNWILQCDPSRIKPSNWSTCPAMQCEDSSLTVGSTTVSSCNTTTCAYAGYNSDQNIFTTLATQSTCPVTTAPGGSPGNFASRIGLSWNYLFISIHLICFLYIFFN
ncbi:LYSM DOMAIN-CONTAINING GPI-ANCHORED PROTEIN 2 [Salix koriyanagi]|uniref:LYSM DOMAIN-CONTAINING GPI-ANCHORED PROTEIN 2 n=1 Tax=Salix koriyanagi TaxID=2511006 RepID=A0A9Q0Z0M2_9ROSI|nr:LYSM DOMAIN-CONTAINING GPI-ANCHORED PROTEIN 2 [Salix koriyanagi]